MDKFCKLYETEDKGQLLVMLDTSDDDGSPQVSIFCQPENLGVCRIKVGFDDTDAGWDKAEAAFHDIDEAKARVFTEDAFRLSDSQETL